MSGNIPTIDEMPSLKAQLGKSRADRVRYAGNSDNSKQRNATNIHNTVMWSMQHVVPHQPGCPIADILYGTSFMDNNQKEPLSVDRLYNILQCMEIINTREVMAMMAIQKRQAQRYVRAIKFILPNISSLV